MIAIKALVQKQGSHGRRKPFHLQYLELSKGKNLQPDPDVRAKDKEFGKLNFFGDRVKVEDWLSIFDSIYQDTSLRYVAIKLRKPANNVFEHLTSLKKTKTLEKAPFLLSTFLFSRFIDSMSNFISITPNLETLALEGLPLRGSFLGSLIKSLSHNQSIKSLSLARSPIGDEGCESICAIVKHLSNIESLNFSQCQLGSRGAAAVAGVIKFQKIARFSEGWKRTLRYKMIDPDTLPGLRKLYLNGNAIGDEGLHFITEEMKDDVWIKILEIQECGLTDEAARHIIDCLNYNSEVLMIDVHGNTEMSAFLLEHIRTQMGMELDNSDESEGTESMKDDLNDPVKLMENIEILQQKLVSENFLKRKTEEMNEKLHQQLLEFQNQLNAASSFGVPEGCTVIEMEVLEKLYKERDELRSKLTEVSLLQPSKRQEDSPKPIKKRSSILHKTKSESIPKHRNSSHTKSEQLIRPPGRAGIPQNQLQQPPTYVEINIGDTCQNVLPILQPATTTDLVPVVNHTDFSGPFSNVLKIFMHPHQFLDSVDPSSFGSSENIEEIPMDESEPEPEPESGSYVEEIFEEEDSDDDHTMIAPVWEGIGE